MSAESSRQCLSPDIPQDTNRQTSERNKASPTSDNAGVSLSADYGEYKEAIDAYTIDIQEFRLYLEEYEEQDARMGLATGLVSMSVDPTIRSTILDIDYPHLALRERSNLSAGCWTLALWALPLPSSMT
jgi:hypothetical protein